MMFHHYIVIILCLASLVNLVLGFWKGKAKLGWQRIFLCFTICAICVAGIVLTWDENSIPILFACVIPCETMSLRKALCE